MVTLQASQSLRRLGRQLFEDIGLVGFDELEWSALIGTGITTIAQPTHDIGIAAMDCLLRRLAGDRSAPGISPFAGSCWSEVPRPAIHRNGGEPRRGGRVGAKYRRKS